MNVIAYKTTFVSIELTKEDLENMKNGQEIYRKSMAYGEEECLVKIFSLPEWENKHCEDE